MILFSEFIIGGGVVLT